MRTHDIKKARYTTTESIEPLVQLFNIDNDKLFYNMGNNSNKNHTIRFAVWDLTSLNDHEYLDNYSVIMTCDMLKIVDDSSEQYGSFDGFPLWHFIYPCETRMSNVVDIKYEKINT